MVSPRTIADYANSLLLDFIDAAHAEIRRLLRQTHGEDWLTHGVNKHVNRHYIDRVEQMLNNPMRTVDMGKTPEDIYGIEHIWQVINGNRSSFPNFFTNAENSNRSQVYLGEIAELRHNIAHRRGSHVLHRRDLIRTLGNCLMILRAFESKEAENFDQLYESLSSGNSPWGAELEGYLPSSDEICAQFVGRRDELNQLSDWLLDSDVPQVLVWGYGGSGKSALAHSFARAIKDGSNEDLIATCWVSAKREEYIQGFAQRRHEDFSDLDTLIKAIWSALYWPDESPDDLSPQNLIAELQSVPSLLVIDDFDTVSQDARLAEFLMYDLRRNTPTRVIYTSRHLVTSLREIEVPPFSLEDLAEFVEIRAKAHGTDKDECLKRISGIQRVTGGYPLFVDDLIRHAHMVGVREAVETWSQRRGDAARQYSLRRQMEYLGQSCGDVLIALAASGKPLSVLEISNIAGVTDEDCESGLRELEHWRFVNKVTEIGSSSPAFSMNGNTKRLVQQTYGQDRRFRTSSDAFKNMTSASRVPQEMAQRIKKIKISTVEKAQTSFSDAKAHLEGEMLSQQLSNRHELHGLLGWLHFRHGGLAIEHVNLARQSFQKSHDLQSRDLELYRNWANMEKEIAERMSNEMAIGELSHDNVATQWNNCEEVVEMGISRCGRSQPLCYLAGYAANREARVKESAGFSDYAFASFGRAIDWYKEALGAPTADRWEVGKGQIYRGLVLCYEGLADDDHLKQILLQWLEYADTGSHVDSRFVSECSRIIRYNPSIQQVHQFRRFMPN